MLKLFTFLILEIYHPFETFVGGWDHIENILLLKKKNILQAIKKTSCAPIMEMGVIKEQVLRENDHEGKPKVTKQ